MEVRMSFEMGDALAVIDRRAAYGAMHVIPLLKQEFGKERAVLPRNSRNQRFFHTIFLGILFSILEFFCNIRNFFPNLQAQGTFKFKTCHFAHLGCIAQAFEQHVGVDTVLAVGAEVVGEYLAVATQPRSGCAARAHSHEVDGQVPRVYAAHINQPQQVLEVGSYLERDVESAKLLIHPAAAVERRVRRHPAQPHLPAAERGRRVVARGALQVVGSHIMNVAIHGIDRRVLHRLGHRFKDVGPGVEIVAVEYSHHLAGGHGYALVHGIVYAAVALAYPPQPPVVSRLVFTDNI